jgi:hypothetical protein
MFEKIFIIFDAFKKVQAHLDLDNVQETEK